MSEFAEEMDNLATEIAKEARMDSVALGDRIDAFKALTPYYLWTLKNKGKDEGDNETPSFDDFTRMIHTKEKVDGEGEPGVRGGRRNGN